MAKVAEDRCIKAIIAKRLRQRLRQVSDISATRLTKGQKVRLSEGEEAHVKFAAQRRENK